MAAPTVAVQLGLGGSMRAAIVASAPSAIWPLSDVFGEAVEEILRDLDGAGDNVSRGDPGFVPEYGSASSFGGTSSYFYVENDGLFQPTTKVGIGFLLLLGSVPAGGATWTLFRKENGGAAGRIMIQLFESAGNVTLRFTANIGATARTVDYTASAATFAAWVSTPRMIVCRYNGSNQQIYQVETSGTVTQLASTARTGVLGTGSTRIYVGATDGTSEFADCSMQWLTWWYETTPSDADLAAFGQAMVWTSVTSDVRAADGIEAEWGIRSTGPQARMATTGTLQFSLDNSATNSASLIGYYSLDHANTRDGFAFGIPVRLTLVDPSGSATYVKFVGRLIQIEPEPNQHGRLITRCTAVDYVDEMARAALPPLTLVEDTLSGAVFGKLVQSLQIRPHDIFGVGDSDGTVEVFPYGLDRAQDERDVMLQEAARIADSELGRVFVRGNEFSGGQLTIQGRLAQAIDVTPDWTITDAELIGLEADRRREDVITRVQITRYPRSVGGSNAVLFTLNIENAQPAIGAGSAVTLRATYTDPDNDGDRIGGTTMVTPVATTDYTANSVPNGSGDDLTALMSVDYMGDPGANSATLRITNNATVTAYMTKLQLRGLKVLTYEPIIAETSADDATLALYGENILSIDQPYHDDAAGGYEAATALLSGWGTPRTVARSATLAPAGASSPAGLTTMAVIGDCGDLVEITETVTGLDAAQYFISGVKLRIDAGPVVRTTFVLAPRDFNMWIVGEAGFSEVGETTVVGY